MSRFLPVSARPKTVLSVATVEAEQVWEEKDKAPSLAPVLAPEPRAIVGVSALLAQGPAAEPLVVERTSRLSVDVPEDEFRSLKMHALARRTTVRALVLDLIRALN